MNENKNDNQKLKLLCCCLISINEYNNWIKEVDTSEEKVTKDIYIPDHGSSTFNHDFLGFSTDDIYDFYTMAVEIIFNSKKLTEYKIKEFYESQGINTESIFQTLFTIDKLLIQIGLLTKKAISLQNIISTNLDLKKVFVHEFNKNTFDDLNWKVQDIVFSIVLLESEKIVLEILRDFK